MFTYEVIDNLPEIDVRFEEALGAIGEHMVQSIQENFDQQGRPNKWPPAKRDTLFMGGTLLKKSGELYNSGVYRTDEGGVTISFGAGLPYAWIQNFGGVTHPTVTEKMKKYFWFLYFESGDEFWKYMALKPIGEVLTINIPARAYMVVQEEDKEFIKSTLRSSVVLTYPDGKVERLQ